MEQILITANDSKQPLFITTNVWQKIKLSSVASPLFSALRTAYGLSNLFCTSFSGTTHELRAILQFLSDQTMPITNETRRFWYLLAGNSQFTREMYNISKELRYYQLGLGLIYKPYGWRSFDSKFWYVRMVYDISSIFDLKVFNLFDYVAHLPASGSRHARVHTRRCIRLRVHDDKRMEVRLPNSCYLMDAECRHFSERYDQNEIITKPVSIIKQKQSLPNKYATFNYTHKINSDHWTIRPMYGPASGYIILVLILKHKLIVPVELLIELRKKFRNLYDPHVFQYVRPFM